MFELKVPEFGESIQEVQVASWFKQPGDFVKKDEELVELESEKASQTLEADRDGVVQEIRVAAGEFAQVGDVLCVIAAGGEAAAPAASSAQSAAVSAVSDEPPQATSTAGAATADQETGQSIVMPAAERVLAEYEISADVITPSGPGWRILKEDVLRYVNEHGLQPAEANVSAAASAVKQPPVLPTVPEAAPDSFAVPDSTAAVSAGPADVAAVVRPTPKPAAPSVARSSPSAASQQGRDGGDDATREEKVVPMSMIRRTIAARLVEAQQTAALLTTFNEINMQPVKELRGKYKDAFQKKHGVKLGFMSFFAKAAVEGLRRFPAINAEVQDKNVVMKNYHDIGIAIGGGKGLVVPVLRNVERMSFADVERSIGHFAGLAQENKITPSDLKGGTFTISNGGVYGSLLSTPIVNPPQSGILGLHTIQERPVAENGQVVIRPMMYVALTYDHRIVDGKEAVGFLKTIKEVLEEPARLFLEV